MPDDPVVKLSELINGIDLAVLTTVRPDQTLHSCPMVSHGIEPNGVLWLLTSDHTDKVEAVRTIQQVSLAFCDPARQRYVSVSGFCELIRDRAKAQQLWKPAYSSWFPGGVDDPKLILMRIVAQQAEYWDSTAFEMVPLVGFQNTLEYH